MSFRLFRTHHDDADTDADPADDVQFIVEHLVNSGRTALTEQQKDVTLLYVLLRVFTDLFSTLESIIIYFRLTK